MMSNKEWVIVDKTKLTAIADTVRATTKSENLIEIDDLGGEVTRAIQIGSGLNTYDATANASEIMLGETAYANGMKVTGTFTIDEELNNQDNLITQIATTLRNKSANTGTDTSDATAIAAEIFEGKTAYIGSGKVTGTFTIEEELNSQDDLIAQITTALEGKAVGGETVVDDVSRAIIEGTITSIEDDRVNKIHQDAFFSQKNLSTVNFPACITIGNDAFNRCSNLATISFPACTSIGESAFWYCISLTTASFPACVEIDRYAFEYCNKLATISLPVCKKIDMHAFASCKSMNKINLPAVETIGACAFNYCYSISIANLPRCTLISTGAFQVCSELASVNIPVCNQINNGAFQYCGKLSTIRIRTPNVCKLEGSNALFSTPFAGYSSYFSGVPYIYVPSSLITAYQSATNWTYFSSYFSAIESLDQNLITFNIDGAEYQAEEEMTWDQWINSEYNTHPTLGILNNTYIGCVNCNKHLLFSEEYDGEFITRDVLKQYIIDETQYYSTLCTCDIITFSINGTNYQAVNGMTWAQWVDSEYNVDGFKNNNYCISRYSGGGFAVIDEENNTIHPNDTIVSNYSYATNAEAPFLPV